MIRINEQKCLKCHACVRDCIVHVLRPNEQGLPMVKADEECYCLHCQHCLAVCPVGAVECDGISPAQCRPIGEMPSPETMMNLIRQRRSIRQYKDEEIDEKNMQKLIQSLAWSPTGCNVHNMAFTVIQHKGEMEFFRAKMSKALRFLIKTGILRIAYPNFRRYMDEIQNGVDVIFRNAPHMIVAASADNAPCKEADPWIALSYFDLLAQSFGIGTCWSGFAVHAFRWIPSMRKHLALPSGYTARAVLLFGYPAVEYKRQTSPTPFQVKLL